MVEGVPGWTGSNPVAASLWTTTVRPAWPRADGVRARQTSRMDGFPLRRVIVGLTIGSFSLAALLGVIALLSGGEFGETQGRVLLTTLVVGVTSVAVLCYLAVGGTPYQPVGILGGLSALPPLVTSLLLIWGGVGESSDWAWKTFIIGLLIGGTFAQICLLLGLSSTRRVLAWILWPTIALAALLAAYVSYLVGAEAGLGDAGLRFIGIVAILDALGTVVAVAMALFGGRGTEASTRADVVRLPPPLAARVAEAAAASGRTPDQVVAEAVEAHLRAP